MSLTKDDLLEVFHIVRTQSAGGTQMAVQPVTSAANNPMTWIAALGFAFTVIIGMAGFIYFANLSGQNTKIDGVATTANSTLSLVRELQTNQTILTQDVKRNAEINKQNTSEIYEIRNSRIDKMDLEGGLAPIQREVEALSNLVKSNKDSAGELERRVREIENGKK